MDKAAKLQKQCDEWNRANPIGVEVEFYPVIRGDNFRLRKTRSEAYVLSGHTAVLFLEGESGCVALEACSRAVSPSDQQE